MEFFQKLIYFGESKRPLGLSNNYPNSTYKSNQEDSQMKNKTETDIALSQLIEYVTPPPAAAPYLIFVIFCTPTHLKIVR